MPGEDDGAVRESGEPLQAVVHRLGVAAWQVGAAAAVEEQGVAGHEAAVDEQALAARGVPWCVQQLDVERRRHERRRRADAVASSSADTPIVRDTQGASAAWTWTGTSTCSSSAGTPSIV